MNFHSYHNLLISFKSAKFENLPQIFFCWKSIISDLRFWYIGKYEHCNMTWFKEDNSDLIDGKALETLKIASVRTLKRGNKKCSREEVSKLVNNLCNEISKDLFNKTLDSLMENQSIKCNIISSWECISLPKDSELHHRSI